ncbi:hypothetical protein [Parvularcula sp. IMCC14364]|uniref:hypothetical protein n=1 Tax=Parvularcula sp. IMCC14364 TaxID=3067902 RepID=UPI0027407844|nr:hypothetical protein [Parvularcula sp. IMCC14364]
MITNASLWGPKTDLQKVVEMQLAGKLKLQFLATKTGQLSVELSATRAPEHWSEVADRLDELRWMLTDLALGNVNVLVATTVERKHLPDGSSTCEPLILPEIAIEALAKLPADFEFAVAHSE